MCWMDKWIERTPSRLGEGLVVGDRVFVIDVSTDRTGRLGDLIQSMSTQITTFTSLISGLQTLW